MYVPRLIRLEKSGMCNLPKCDLPDKRPSYSFQNSDGSLSVVDAADFNKQYERDFYRLDARIAAGVDVRNSSVPLVSVDRNSIADAADYASSNLSNLNSD